MKSQSIPSERIHITEYGILFICAYLYHSNKKVYATEKEYTSYRFGFLYAICVSLLDESIQYVTPERVGELRDIAANVSAACFGLTIILIIKDRH